MASHETGIEWTHQDEQGYRGATWNPLGAFDKETDQRGWFCTHVSEGCRHCYAEKLNVQQRTGMGTGHEYKHQNVSEIDFRLVGMDKPIRKTKPRAYFVNSMTDLFHPEVQTGMIDRIVAVMAMCPEHRFMILTKRPEVMLDWWNGARERVVAAMKALAEEGKAFEPRVFNWPLPNVWLGVSAENQDAAFQRISQLINLPTEVTTFVSAEPLIGPIDLTETVAKIDGLDSPLFELTLLDLLDWVIVGGESGKEARPMDPTWARMLRDQCRAQRVPYFFKQGSQNNWESHKNEETFPDDLLIREFPDSDD